MATTKITVNNNGSLKVEGDFEIVDKNGNVYDLAGRDVVSICRCGRSQNKPFCDGSHKGHFEHEAIAFSLPPKREGADSQTMFDVAALIDEAASKIERLDP